MNPQVSDSELELMKIIWEQGGRALYAAIMERLAAAGNCWQKNTVITLLSRLVEKGFLKTSKMGHRNEYIALVSREDYQLLQTRSFLDKHYAGNARGLVLALMQKELLSAEDYEELRRFWEEKRQEK